MTTLPCAQRQGAAFVKDGAFLGFLARLAFNGVPNPPMALNRRRNVSGDMVSHW